MPKGLILALVCAVPVLLSGCGGSASTTRAAGTTLRSRHAGDHSKTRASRAPVRPVRNATPQPGWLAYRGPVPILVYHGLGQPPPGAYPGLYVSDADFSREMEWLHRRRYQAVTLDEVMRAWYHGGRLPAKPIVITFDNGYGSWLPISRTGEGASGRPTRTFPKSALMTVGYRRPS